MRIESLIERFTRATPEQREQILRIIRFYAQSGSKSEPEQPTHISHKICDNCSLQMIKQSLDNPYVLEQSCPAYKERKWNSEIGRMSCIAWTNRRYVTNNDEEDSGDENESCES
jgi:hypothetical protein